MKGRIVGRITAAALGAALGLVAAELRMPMETVRGTALVNRIPYVLGNTPRRGDLVVIENAVFTESGDARRLLLQVAGLSGERIQLREGRVLVDSEDVTESLSLRGGVTEEMDAVIVKEGFLFLLSTEGDHHLDSRSEAVGQVAEKDVWGKVCFVFEREKKEERHGTETAFGEQ